MIMRKRLAGLLAAMVLMAPGCVEYFPLSLGEEIAFWAGVELAELTAETAADADWAAGEGPEEREGGDGF